MAALPDVPKAMLRLAAALLLWVAVAAPAAAFDLAALMALLAQKRSGEAEFIEQRFVKSLDEPLTSTGLLSFAAPDRFVRKTLKPRLETLQVDGNNVTMTRGGRSRSFALDATPEMGAVVEALRGTLTGNGATVQRHFEAALTGSAEQWTLSLTPLESGLAGRVRNIRIGGRHGELDSIEMQLTDGDRSLMTITPARPARAASAP